MSFKPHCSFLLKTKGKKGKHSSLIGWIDLSGPKSVEKHRKKVRRWARETEVEEEEEEMERGGVLELSCLHLCMATHMHAHAHTHTHTRTHTVIPAEGRLIKNSLNI